MQDDFGQCLVLNTRMAARAVTRRADRKLRPFGVTAAQFTILTSLVALSGRSVTEMAEAIAMDRSTLSRNLDLLERKGLVGKQPAASGNGRTIALTKQGEALVERMIPVWRQSQAELRESLSTPDVAALLVSLKQLAHL